MGPTPFRHPQSLRQCKCPVGRHKYWLNYTQMSKSHILQGWGQVTGLPEGAFHIWDGPAPPKHLPSAPPPKSSQSQLKLVIKTVEILILPKLVRCRPEILGWFGGGGVCWGFLCPSPLSTLNQNLLWGGVLHPALHGAEPQVRSGDSGSASDTV